MDVKVSKVEAENLSSRQADASIAIATLSISNKEIWKFYS